jgi:hypothetical protein
VTWHFGPVQAEDLGFKGAITSYGTVIFALSAKKKHVIAIEELKLSTFFAS